MRHVIILAMFVFSLRAEDWRLTSDAYTVKIFEDFEPSQVSIAGEKIVSIRTKAISNDGRYAIRIFYFRLSNEGCDWSMKNETFFLPSGKIWKSCPREDSQLTWIHYEESSHALNKPMAERAIKALKSLQ
jgi:hypothetical protein